MIGGGGRGGGGSEEDLTANTSRSVYSTCIFLGVGGGGGGIVT